MSNQEESGWLRLELITSRGEIHGSRLFDLGALGVEVQDHETYMDDAPFAPVPEGKVRLIAYFEAQRGLATLKTQIEESLGEAEIISVADYSDRSWETAWMKYFQPTQISRHVSVGPPWDAPVAPEGGIAVTIEPGMAFGTGTHETTRLCARMLDDLIERESPPAKVLDVGCGSAILSMIASGLGAKRVVGIDIDKTSVSVAKENIEKNGFTPEEIELSTTPLADVEGTFDVVVANILATILMGLKDGLIPRVAPGGFLLLSGIPVVQLKEVRTHFEEPGFQEIDEKADGEWAALLYRREG